MRIHHELIIGDTYQGRVVVKEGGVVVNLAEASNPVMQLRNGKGDLLLSPSVEITDAPNGVLEWTSPAEATAGLPECQAVLGLRLTLPGGAVRTVLEAVVTVRRGPVQ